MRSLPSRFLIPASLLGMVVSHALGQQIPKRPDLRADADTNEAGAYYQYGLEQLQRDNPGRASDAFYWASRLDPKSAATRYARRVALLLDEGDGTVVGYFERKEKVLRKSEIQQIDSLAYLARLRDPFFFRGLDWQLLITYMTNRYERAMRRAYGQQVRKTNRTGEFIEQFLLENFDELELSDRAAFAYLRGWFHDALSSYAQLLLDREVDAAWVHVQRGEAFFLAEMYDSSVVQLERALELRRREDAEEAVLLYESKAMLEYSLGHVLEVIGDYAGARDAFSRAAFEDLAFYPAHLRLANLALASADTVEALAELELAAELGVDDALTHLALGVLLYEIGRPDDAVRPFEQCVRLEPHYADAFLMLAAARQGSGDLQGAVEEFDAFLLRASLANPRREWASVQRELIHNELSVRQ